MLPPCRQSEWLNHNFGESELLSGHSHGRHAFDARITKATVWFGMPAPETVICAAVTHANVSRTRVQLPPAPGERFCIGEPKEPSLNCASVEVRAAGR